MNRLDALFARKKENILNVYFTAGYPKLEDTVPIIRGLAEGGVDLIEIGMPYSDPMADGTTIQQSSMQALKNGMTLELLFEQIREAREYTQVPIILMGYYNQVLQFGTERFVQFCTSAGPKHSPNNLNPEDHSRDVDGLILPDLPLAEYQENFQPLMDAAGLRFSFLITPQTSEARIRAIDAASDGFIYVVSSSAITGNTSGISPAQKDYFARIEAMQLSSPCLIGFGISNAQSFQTACQYAHGAIIGSAFIRALGEGGSSQMVAHDFVKAIKG
ncbi:MAG: tryptophan synthase subunit alpha [Bacteroidota bacterium]